MIPEQIAAYILLFFVSSGLGWMMEVICKLIQFGRFINRGFLIGPLCPIYGFGSVFLCLMLERFTDSPFEVFLLAMVVCGALEYLTSYCMEKFFHARWWDYSQKRFNLNGRICADTLIPFGLLGLAMLYLIKPFLFTIFAKIPHPALSYLVDGFCVLFDRPMRLYVCANENPPQCSPNRGRFHRSHHSCGAEQVGIRICTGTPCRQCFPSCTPVQQACVGQNACHAAKKSV